MSDRDDASTDSSGRYGGQVVVVTGGGSGIGRDLALGFARDGARVATLDRDRSAGLETAAMCEVGRAYECDVASPGGVRATFEAIDDDLGPVDVLVNGAGIAPVDPDVTARVVEDVQAMLSGGERLSLRATSTMSDERWDRTLRVHVYGTFHCTREALRRMEPRRRGAILNIASTSALRGQAPTPDYSAAKGAIVSFTKSTALEVVGAGIRVNAVAPGWVETPMTAGLDPRMKRFILAQIPQGRFGTVAEVTALALHLCSAEASYTTGQIVSPNGGLYT